MSLDLTLSDAIRLTTALLLSAFGAFVLARGRRVPRGPPLGLMLVTLSLSIFASNLFYNEPGPDTIARGVDLALTLAALAFAFVLARAEDARGGVAIVAGSAVLGLVAGIISIQAGIVEISSLGLRSAAPPALETAGVIAFLTVCGALGGCAIVWARRAAREPVEAAGLGELAAGLGVYVLVYLGVDNAADARFLLAGLLAAAPLLAAVALWARVPTARPAFVLLVALPTAAILADGATKVDIGIFGLTRVATLAILAHAVFRRGALGPSERPTRDRRAAVLTTFLVVLLIVAQVAQNFLEAQYGLLMGGVVAGALLVAARPIERALERRHDARVSQPDAAKEDAYRAAVRMALRDRVLTREEELHLHRVAQHMGIPTGRAHELLIEVERETR